MQNNPAGLCCLREPIPEIHEAAYLLDCAISAHFSGNSDQAASLIKQANMPAIREWTESLWGPGGPFSKPKTIPNSPPYIPKKQRMARMPSTADKHSLLIRDGYHCRFCGIPVIRAETRNRIKDAYPHALQWGSTNKAQHASFQAMWAQYDHLLPHARGGTSDLENMVITCAPCNYGRTDCTLEEVGLADPRLREPVSSPWDGLERFR